MRIRGLVLFAATAMVALGASCARPGNSADQRSDAPNFIVIMTDDQTMEQMRVLESTRREIGDAGVTFTNSYTNYPTCCPSRATFLTGQHASNHGVLWNSPPTGGFQEFEDQGTTMPVALQKAGYRTAFVGKYLNGFGQRPEDRFVPPGWDDFEALVAPSEVLYYGYTMFDNGDLVDYGSAPSDHVSDVLGERALHQVSQLAAEDDPFFLYFAPIAPHGRGGARVGDPNLRVEISDQMDLTDRPFLRGPVPAPRHVGDFASEPAPSNPAIDETDVQDKPKVNRRRALGPEDRKEIEASYRLELESLLAVDETVAALVERLDELGELDRTYLIFTSDNGYFHGEHQFLGFKYQPYEPGIRVPLLIRGPGVVQGVSNPSLVSNIDLAPTILDLAGAKPLREPDGRSLVPLLTDRAARWGRAILLEGHAPATDLRAPYLGVHTGNAVYIEYDTGGSEYYDLSEDPWQLENRVLDPASQDEVARLRKLLAELSSCVGDSCRIIGSEESVPEPGTARDENSAAG